MITILKIKYRMVLYDKIGKSCKCDHNFKIVIYTIYLLLTFVYKRRTNFNRNLNNGVL